LPVCDRSIARQAECATGARGDTHTQKGMYATVSYDIALCCVRWSGRMVVYLSPIWWSGDSGTDCAVAPTDVDVVKERVPRHCERMTVKHRKRRRWMTLRASMCE
jgi:hypothetical protein